MSESTASPHDSTEQQSTEDEIQDLIESAATICSENGFDVADTDVQRLSDEIWGFIWLSGQSGKPKDSRQQAAKSLLEEHVKTADTDLPTSVNLSCGTAGDSAVAVWI